MLHSHVCESECTQTISASDEGHMRSHITYDHHMCLQATTKVSYYTNGARAIAYLAALLQEVTLHVAATPAFLPSHLVSHRVSND